MDFERHFAEPERKHGPMMVLFLGFTVLLCFAGVLLALLMAIAQISLNAASLALYPQLALLFLMVVVYFTGGFYIYGVWRWQRWGVYGIFALYLASVLFAAMTGVPLGFLLLTPCGFFWWMTRTKWKLYQ
jgi:hypothetical protein